MNEETPKDVPIYKVRANQVGMVAAIAVAIIFQYPWLLAVTWIILVMTRLLGPGANAFVIVFEPITKLIYGEKHTEAEELQHFNLNLAIIFITTSLLCFSLSWNLAGYIVAGVMGICALLALFGFCIGCTLYFQLKKYRALRDRKINEQ